jgi:hypothetical protein
MPSSVAMPRSNRTAEQTRPILLFPAPGSVARFGLNWGASRGRLWEEYRERMRTRAKEDREYAILGHRLEVYLSGDDRWSVAVDGQAIPSSGFGNSYAAWAVGAAESYRQGRVPGSPPVHD